MQELSPGLYDWTTFHEGIGTDVHSHFHAPSGTLIDPRVPEEGLDAFAAFEPRRIVLTNRHHYRHSAEFAQAFGCPVLCHEAGLHEFAGSGREVAGFAWGDRLAPDVLALEVGVLCPEETALLLGAEALAIADAVIGSGDGELGFVSDSLLGDDPPAIRAGLNAALGRIAAEHDFSLLLLAHGPPIRDGRAVLRAFAT